MEPKNEIPGIDFSDLIQELEDTTESADTAEIAAVFSSLAQDDPAGSTAIFTAQSTAGPAPAQDGSTAVFSSASESGGLFSAELPAADVKQPQTRISPPSDDELALDMKLPTSEEQLYQRMNAVEKPEAPDSQVSAQGPTIRVVSPGEKPASAHEESPEEASPASRFSRLRELKRKIVAGPEKQYYSLHGIGVGKLQLGILCNVVILLICCAAIAYFTLDMVPVNRIKLMVFGQVLAMLLSGLLGSSIMIDGISDLLHLRYSLNTTLVISFLACCADAWFCLDEQRVPCCSAFVLQMTMAMLARYYKRSTEMAQMDTLRKASSLTSLIKEPKYFEKYDGIVRGQGDVEDFMDTYSRTSGPEIVQRVYAFVALIACTGIAVLAYLLHGTSLAVQIFAASLMVATPASYFIALTRPASLLEQRLHMVGTVLCGWQGVKKLCGKAVFPLRDKDFFPKGATKLNGIKFYSDRTNAQVVSYASSLIFAAGGGLVPLFRNLLNSRSGFEYPVVNFRDYGNGGIGGEVNDEPVLLGTQEFLQSMGVEIPVGTMVNQAIYVSIDGQLTAVIAITYAKMRSAAAGIVSLCSHRKLKPLLLAGDFMLTDSFICGKFAIRSKRMITPSRDVRASLAARKPDPEADVLALVTRDDLSASVYAVTGAMALRASCRLGSFLHILGGAAGIVAMVLLAYLGAFELLTPAHVILYQLAWLIPAWLATEWTRTV